MKATLSALVLHLFFLALLLLSAGRVSYWPGWAYVALGLLASAGQRLALRGASGLARERGSPRSDAKGWDKKVLALGFVLTLAMLVVGGLDAGRFHFRPVLTWPFFAVGVALDLVGTALFLRALKENRFFSAVVRIQSDRGHAVCSSGPYRVVRHPGYAGMILGTLGIPLVLMSAWSAVPALLFVALTVLRTRWEDAALTDELAGYREYRQATRYRLVPGVW